jgi:hypothetical protein
MRYQHNRLGTDFLNAAASAPKTLIDVELMN